MEKDRRKTAFSASTPPTSITLGFQRTEERTAVLLQPSSILTWRILINKQTLIALIAVLALTDGHADEWTGRDKAQHATVGVVLGSLGTAASKSPTVGCLIGAGAGLAKEVYDGQHPDKHTASFKDFVVTAGFACLAAKVTGLLISPTGVTFNWEF